MARVGDSSLKDGEDWFFAVDRVIHFAASTGTRATTRDQLWRANAIYQLNACVSHAPPPSGKVGSRPELEEIAAQAALVIVRAWDGEGFVVAEL